MEYQNEQFSYDNWSQNSPANKQEMFCGGDKISTNEKYFINTYAKSNCLDVGCGTGNRTFLYYENRQIDYIGVEKYDHLIEYSNNSTKILKKDITSNSFHLDEIKNQKSDVAFYFGGVINGFISESARLHGWENIEEVAKKHANYILVDTLSHFPWFCDEFEKLGCELKLDCDLEFTWTELINSDVLIMSIGSFSYIPAMYNKGFVIFYPAWYKKISHWNDNDDSDLYKNLKNFLNSKYEHL